MCGIAGYTGRRSAAEVILSSLETLEYRGYDCAGLALQTQSGLKVVKAQGRVSRLRQLARGVGEESGCGIGHTRWATHGRPSDVNAHPHGTQRLMLVHNGIIENHESLRSELEKRGCVFSSQTDTETAALLIDRLYGECGDMLTALAAAQKRLVGSYALAVISASEPGRIYAVRRDSPLIIGIGDGECFVASDTAAFSDYTRSALRLGQGQLAAIDADNVSLYDSSLNSLGIEPQEIPPEESGSGETIGGSHMLGEIYEQPSALERELEAYASGGIPDFSPTLPSEFFTSFSHVCFIGCGTALNAGRLGAFYFERLARLRCCACAASEFRYEEPIIGERELFVVISQSGETADALAALELIKGRRCAGAVCVVNCRGSAMHTLSERTLLTHAGRETAVASTKAFTSQCTVLYMLAVRTALARAQLDVGGARELIGQLYSAVRGVRLVLFDTHAIKKAAEALAGASDAFFIGRGADAVLCREASLKLKEITYIHSEALPAGELKHGTISLIESGTRVVALCSQTKTAQKMRSSILELKARGAFVICVCPKSRADIFSCCDITVTLPELPPFASLLAQTAAVQTLACEAARILGRDIDKPRNLAKSVTVE